VVVAADAEGAENPRADAAIRAATLVPVRSGLRTTADEDSNTEVS
jgi:hypothetical protein